MTSCIRIQYLLVIMTGNFNILVAGNSSLVLWQMTRKQAESLDKSRREILLRSDNHDHNNKENYLIAQEVVEIDDYYIDII
jgi:hypothetical protein